MDKEERKQQLNVFEKWEVDMVKKRARTLVGKFGFTYADLEDIEQDLFLTAYLKKSQGKPLTQEEEKSLRRILDNKMSDIIKGAKRDKRRVRLVSESLSKPVEQGGDEMSIQYSDVLDEDKVRALVGRISQSKEDELRREFWITYESLSDRQKQIFLMRCDEIPVSEAANRLSLHRDTIYEELKSIRIAFEKRGLL